MKQGDKAIHCLTFEQFTIARIVGGKLIGGSKAFPIEECELSVMDQPLDESSMATLLDLARIAIEDSDPSVFAYFSTLSEPHKQQFWTALSEESREQLSQLSAVKAA